MKKRYLTLIAAALVVAALTISCKDTPRGNNQQAEQEQATPTKTEKRIMDFITNMYNSNDYIEPEFLKAHCTPSMLQFLRDNYDYDTDDEEDCFACWLFRTSAQDGKPDSSMKNEIISVNHDGEGDWYTYEFYDEGWRGENRIKVIVTDDQLLIDGLERIYDEPSEYWK